MSKDNSPPFEPEARSVNGIAIEPLSWPPRHFQSGGIPERRGGLLRLL